jgi:hypothetical protein
MGQGHARSGIGDAFKTVQLIADFPLDFLRGKLPKTWRKFQDSVTDNFRVINPEDFQVLT